MTTQVRSEQIREEMRAMLTAKSSRKDVITELKLSRSAYYRHLKALMEEDPQWLNELARGEFVSEYRKAHDILEELEKRLLVIADRAETDGHRIEALRLCKEVEMDRVALLAEGPVALAVRKRVRKELGTQQSTQV